MRRVEVNGPDLADGLLLEARLLQRRLHRRFEVLRPRRAQRQPAAVPGPEQHPRRLEQQRVEPGLLRGRGGTRAEIRLRRPSTRPWRPARSPRKSRSCRWTPAATTACSFRRCAATRWDRPGPAARRRAARSPIQRFFIATPGDPVPVINAALARGQDLILTPGVYHLHQTIEITRPDTVVLGLGFPTLVPAQRHRRDAGRQRSPGVKLSGMIFEAGPVNSPVLLQVGSQPGPGPADPADPTLVQDVFFRIGGAAAGPGDDQPGGRQLPGHPRRHLGLAGRPRPRGRLDRQRRGHRRRSSTGTTSPPTACSSSITRRTR